MIKVTIANAEDEILGEYDILESLPDNLDEDSLEQFYNKWSDDVGRDIFFALIEEDAKRK